jgi:hypothetical protein
VDACIDRIRCSPEHFAFIHLEFRRALVKRFPYAVYFENDVEEIRVYAVMHSARDQDKWKLRLPRDDK